MTRKDYEKVAALLKYRRTDGISDPDTVSRIADDLITWFGCDNPNFDRERFLKAIGIE